MFNVFQESDLEFKFSDRWLIKSFDDHPFYKILAGQGLKGVDFVGILNYDTVVLIEVKNYKIRLPTSPPAIQEKIAGEHPAIIKTLQQKASDTQRVLRIIRKYYKRRPWLRPLHFLLKKMPLDYQLSIEWQFWLWLESKVAQGDYLLVLWLELEKEYDLFDKKEIQKAKSIIQKQLKKELSDVIANDAILVSSEEPYILNEKISVRSLL
ncbi:MAG: hypothetical protein AB8G22_19950 [Saprospiraceae bacterium]